MLTIYTEITPGTKSLSRKQLEPGKYQRRSITRACPAHTPPAHGHCWRGDAGLDLVSIPVYNYLKLSFVSLSRNWIFVLFLTQHMLTW